MFIPVCYLLFSSYSVILCVNPYLFSNVVFPFTSLVRYFRSISSVRPFSYLVCSPYSVTLHLAHILFYCIFFVFCFSSDPCIQLSCVSYTLCCLLCFLLVSSVSVSEYWSIPNYLFIFRFGGRQWHVGHSKTPPSVPRSVLADGRLVGQAKIGKRYKSKQF